MKGVGAAARGCWAQTLTPGSERKTGVKRAEVITARLVQDSRGWLRLAG